MAFADLSQRTGALFGLDTMVFVHLVEAHERLGKPAREVFRAAEAGRCRLVASILALLEVLVLPKKQGRDDLCRVYRETFQAYPNLMVVEVGPEIAEIASDLRARYVLRTPDAIHLATAIQAGADAFITEDGRLKKVKDIAVLPLDVAATWGTGEVHEPRPSYGTLRTKLRSGQGRSPRRQRT